MKVKRTREELILDISRQLAQDSEAFLEHVSSLVLRKTVTHVDHAFFYETDDPDYDKCEECGKELHERDLMEGKCSICSHIIYRGH